MNKTASTVLTSAKLFIIMVMIMAGVRTEADPGKIFTEVLVINQSNYEEFEDIFSEAGDKRIPVLKFLPHPRNPNYLSIYHCFITSEEQALGGRNCRAVSGGEYFDIQGLRDLETAVETRRMQLSFLKEAAIFVVTLPVGGFIYRGLAKGIKYAHSGAMAYRSVRWGAFGVSLAADILIGVGIDEVTERAVKIGRNTRVDNIRCGKDDRNCESKEALVVVKDKVNLSSTFRKLNNVVPDKAFGRKYITAHHWVEKKPSRDCRNCFKLEVTVDLEEMYKHPVY